MKRYTYIHSALVHRLPVECRLTALGLLAQNGVNQCETQRQPYDSKIAHLEHSTTTSVTVASPITSPFGTGYLPVIDWGLVNLLAEGLYHVAAMSAILTNPGMLHSPILKPQAGRMVPIGLCRSTRGTYGLLLSLRHTDPQGVLVALLPLAKHRGQTCALYRPSPASSAAFPSPRWIGHNFSIWDAFLPEPHQRRVPKMGEDAIA